MNEPIKYSYVHDDSEEARENRRMYQAICEDKSCKIVWEYINPRGSFISVIDSVGKVTFHLNVNMPPGAIPLEVVWEVRGAVEARDLQGSEVRISRGRYLLLRSSLVDALSRWPMEPGQPIARQITIDEKSEKTNLQYVLATE